MAFKSNILNSLQPQFREYYKTGRGGENLTFEQRRLLDAVRDKPQPGQLQALSAYLVGAGGNSKVAEDALYNVGVALGTTRKRVADFWTRLTRLEDYDEFVPLEGRPTEDYAANMPYQSTRVPGGTNRDPSDAGAIGAAVGSAITGTSEPEADTTVSTEEAFARAEFGVGGPASGRPVTETVEGGYEEPVPTDTGNGAGGAGDVVDQTDLDAAIPEDWKDAAREAYPQYYAIVKNIPEIAALLEKAINQGYSDAQFQAELEQTNWWKQTTAAAREWDINGERDPASQQTLIDNRTAFIQQTSLDTFGVRISAETAAELAVDSLRLDWGQQFLLNSIGDVATQSTAGISQLRAGYIGQELRKTANDYGIAISEGTFNQYVNEIAVGKETQDTFQQYALTQAKNLFPSVADRLDAGETFQDIVDPYRQNAGKLLEIDPDSIDFTSPDWAKAITYQDEKGEQRPMNFTEFNDYVRQTRSFGYEYTDQAKNKAYKVANDLANLFGRI